MPRLKLTKTVVETAQPEKEPYELRDAAIPGFLLKVTPMGRKVFMMAYSAECPAMRTSTSASQACGSTSLSFAVTIKL